MSPHPYLKPDREYTEKQLAFLENLMPCKGNISASMRAAGYAESTHPKDVVGVLQDEMIACANHVLANHSIQAAFGLVGVLDDPTAMGAKNSIAAATQVLDRIGIVKKEKVEVSSEQGGVFILPPKRESDD